MSWMRLTNANPRFHGLTTVPLEGGKSGWIGEYCELCVGGGLNDSAHGRGPSNNNLHRRSVPGEYFSTTITGGPNINFKSAKEENTYGQSKHQPGIGAAISLGTAFPINNKVGVAVSIGFKQNNASEKFNYTEPGGGGGASNYKDDYKYSYVGASLLCQYWITNNLAIAAGPQVDYLVNASLKRESDSKKESIKNSSIAVGLDAKIGLKYEIPNGNRRSKWGLSLFYDHRISRLNKKEDNGFPVPAYRMKSVHLGLNYFLCGKCGKPKKTD